MAACSPKLSERIIAKIAPTTDATPLIPHIVETPPSNRVDALTMPKGKGNPIKNPGTKSSKTTTPLRMAMCADNKRSITKLRAGMENAIMAAAAKIEAFM